MTVTVDIGAICVIGTQKILTWILEKKQARLITEQEASEAKEYLREEPENAIEEIETNDGGKAE